MGLPATMRAVLLTGFGGFDRLEVRSDVPVPCPGPGEVLINVGAAALNNTDINTRVGWYSSAVDGATEAGSASGFADAQGEGWSGAPFVFPRIQGIDASGRIVAVGEGVETARIGQRVLVEPCFRSADGSVRYFGSECDGAFADYAVVPAVHAVPINSALSDVALAAFPCAFSTAENMIARLRVATGDRVLITGASGGVGSAAVQLAKRRGAHVTAMAGASKHDQLRDAGADAMLDRGETPGKDRFDAVIDVVGGEGFAALLAALRPGGRYATAGAIAGPVVSLDLRTLYLKDLTFYGCTVLAPGVFSDLVGYIERSEIRSLVCDTFALEEIVAAQHLFLKKGHVGKIVLDLERRAAGR